MIVTRASHSPTHMQRKQGGYIVIIVLLLTAVLLMLGLSLATRTTEEVYQSGQEADTTRVFNAAETGIEAALYQIETDPTLEFDANLDVINGISNPDTLSDLTVEGELAEDFDISIPQGEVLTLGWKADTKINWIHPANCSSNTAALIITLYNSTGPVASHVAYDPFGTDAACTKGSNFAKASRYPVSGTLEGSRIVLTAALFGGGAIGADSLIRIRPLYADANFHVEDSAATRIVSTAIDKGSTTEGKETRKIEVIRTEPAAPSIFDYAVFSGGSLEKN